MGLEKTYIYYLRDAQSIYQGGLVYASDGAAGMDLRACQEEAQVEIPAGGRCLFPAGIIIEPPAYVAGFVYSRSGLGARDGLVVAQGVGLIDPDYRGEIMVYLLNTSKEPRLVQRGDRIAQLVFQPFIRMDMQAVSSPTELSATCRGSGGFGHTGKA